MTQQVAVEDFRDSADRLNDAIDAQTEAIDRQAKAIDRGFWALAFAILVTRGVDADDATEMLGVRAGYFKEL